MAAHGILETIPKANSKWVLAFPLTCKAQNEGQELDLEFYIRIGLSTRTKTFTKNDSNVLALNLQDDLNNDLYNILKSKSDILKTTLYKGNDLVTNLQIKYISVQNNTASDGKLTYPESNNNFVDGKITLSESDELDVVVFNHKIDFTQYVFEFYNNNSIAAVRHTVKFKAQSIILEILKNSFGFKGIKPLNLDKSILR